MKKIYDFTIIGNGVIGSFIAYNLLKKKNLSNLALIGPKKRMGSASIASMEQCEWIFSCYRFRKK